MPPLFPPRAPWSALILVVLPGCASGVSGVDALPDRMFSGHLVTEVRANWFRPCRADPGAAPLWVTFTNASVGQIAEARSRGVALPGDTTFVRWRAAPVEGLVGPGGPALLVRDIAEVRAEAPGDCEDATGDGREQPAGERTWEPGR